MMFSRRNKVDLGRRFKIGGIWLTIIDIDDSPMLSQRQIQLKIGKFDSLSEAQASPNQAFWRSAGWVQERMARAEVLDG